MSAGGLGCVVEMAWVRRWFFAASRRYFFSSWDGATEISLHCQLAARCQLTSRAAFRSFAAGSFLVDASGLRITVVNVV